MYIYVYMHVCIYVCIYVLVCVCVYCTHAHCCHRLLYRILTAVTALLPIIKRASERERERERKRWSLSFSQSSWSPLTYRKQ